MTNGEDALDFLHGRGEYESNACPDLVLLEPQLPGKSGMEILSELNDEPALAEIPVVVLTGSDAEEDIVKSQDVDADHYIQKPVTPDDFFQFVRSIEDFWFAIVQEPTS